MSETRCKDCQYFVQHYALGKRKLFRICCGHCIFAKTRRKLPDAICCEHYTPGTPDEEAFASREYLSKEMLQYVLNMELLPEIEDRG